MNQYLTGNEWSVIEDQFYPEYLTHSALIYSLGNGRIGQRGSFEEKYTNQHLPGHDLPRSYCAVSKQINEDPGYPPKITNSILPAPDWLEIGVNIDGYELDLAYCKVTSFRRELNLREGYLERTFQAELPDGKMLEVSALRFVSLADDELGAIRYALMPLNFSGQITLTPAINAENTSIGPVTPEFNWSVISQEVEPGGGFLLVGTQHGQVQVGTGMRLQLDKDGTGVETTLELLNRPFYVANRLTAPVNEGEQLVIYKYVAVVSTNSYSPDKLEIACNLALERAVQIGFAEMLDAQAAVWAEKWQESNVIIKGDAATQQALHYNLFQVMQAYTGEDEQLGISQSGLTRAIPDIQVAWQTDWCCLPFFLGTSPAIARNLLIYRHHQLSQAHLHANNNGFSAAAALYPANAPDDEILNNHQEISLLPNAVLAFNLIQYYQYTGDLNFLLSHGLEMLIGLARCWAEWASNSPEKYATHQNGPENNLLVFPLPPILDALNAVKIAAPYEYQDLLTKLDFNEAEAVEAWQEINARQREWLSRELITNGPEKINKNATAKSLIKPNPNFPEISPNFIGHLINFILTPENLNEAVWRQFYQYYNPGFTPQSTEGYTIACLMAARHNQPEKAFSCFQHLANLPLKQETTNPADGLSLAGLGAAWLALVYGLAGWRVTAETVYLDPILPATWQSYTFTIWYRGQKLQISVLPAAIKILNEGAQPLSIFIHGQRLTIPANQVTNYPVPAATR